MVSVDSGLLPGWRSHTTTLMGTHGHVSRQQKEGGANACTRGAKCTHMCPASGRHAHAHTRIQKLHRHKCTHTHRGSLSGEGSVVTGEQFQY